MVGEPVWSVTSVRIYAKCGDRASRADIKAGHFDGESTDRELLICASRSLHLYQQRGDLLQAGIHTVTFLLPVLQLQGNLRLCLIALPEM
jgi:hypothetical protein